MAPRPLLHQDAEKKDDETLRAEARAHLAEQPSLQLAAELLTKLRIADLPFWSPRILRERWPASERMRFYRQRPDLRQAVTTRLTGLASKAARTMTPELQATIIDSVVNEGDIPVRAFEDAFEPVDLVTYGPAAAFWFTMRDLLPWHDDAPAHQEIAAWLIRALLADTSSITAVSRVPILTAWDLRTAIDGRVWHLRVPLEVRVAIDDARFSQEKDRPGVPFHAQDDLAIAVPDILATSIPLRELGGVLDAAEKSMGFTREPPRAGPPNPGPGVAARTPEVRSREAPPPQPSAGAPVASQAEPPAQVPPTLTPPAKTTAVSLRDMARSGRSIPAEPSVTVEAAPALPATPAATASPLPMPNVTATTSDIRRIGPRPGVPTLDDDLEHTNPWVVPSPQELAALTAEGADGPQSFDPESAIPGVRRRAQ